VRNAELYLRSGKITQQQLDEAVKMQRLTKKNINEILVEIGAITERQIVEILEVQLGLPSVKLFEFPIDRSVVLTITEAVARKHCLIPIQRQGGKIKVAIADPLNYEAIEEVRLLTGSMIQPLIAAKSEIEEAIRQHYRLEDSMDELLDEIDFSQEINLEEEQDEQSAPIIRLVHQIIQSAVLQKASDIHMDPQERQVLVRYRLDGILQTEKIMPKSMQNVLTARLKIMAKLNIAEKRLPQDGRIHMKIERSIIDIRVSTLPTVFGESIVLRILDQSAGIKKINELHFSESNDRNFEKMIQKPYGLLLISGPTGSGKTSTLYSALNQLNRQQRCGS
jgi:type IV pilus assembly protein PilB